MFRCSGRLCPNPGSGRTIVRSGDSGAESADQTPPFQKVQPYR